MEDRNDYSSLSDIMRRKAQLKDSLTANERRIGSLWKTLFQQDKSKANQSPSMRLANIISTSAGLLDGALLGWKLYRRFVK